MGYLVGVGKDLVEPKIRKYIRFSTNNIILLHVASYTSVKQIFTVGSLCASEEYELPPLAQHTNELLWFGMCGKVTFQYTNGRNVGGYSSGYIINETFRRPKEWEIRTDNNETIYSRVPAYDESTHTYVVGGNVFDNARPVGRRFRITSYTPVRIEFNLNNSHLRITTNRVVYRANTFLDNDERLNNMMIDAYRSMELV